MSSAHEFFCFGSVLCVGGVLALCAFTCPSSSRSTFRLAVKGSRPGKNVQLTESEIRGLCLKSREIFLSQPILLELEAPLKICGELKTQCTHTPSSNRGRAVLPYAFQPFLLSESACRHLTLKNACSFLQDVLALFLDAFCFVKSHKNCLIPFQE